MKLSIAWIFDHIKANWKEQDIPSVIAALSAQTAEIESFTEVSTDLSDFTLAQVIKVSSKGIAVYSAELKKEFLLPERTDIVIGQYYAVKKEKRAYNWATLRDLGSQKDGLLTALWCPEDMLKGQWKEVFETRDIIIELDNKAVTNRPDLWGHRGFAREIAAILHKQLLPEDLFLASKPIRHYTQKAPVSAQNPFTLEIAGDPLGDTACATGCKRLAGLYINTIEYRASMLAMATRLARVDSRPIDLCVDITNYVMFDLGQPMHAFDAALIPDHKIVARCARADETLQLLDGETIKLTKTDMVIADGKKPIALAGIMGGAATAVTYNTHSLLVESANFDPVVIRRTATRIKKRTEASTRFEKSLDPNQNTQAILRFLKILNDAGVAYEAADAIASVGALVQEKIITVEHELFVNKIVMSVDAAKIDEILTRLGFGVQVTYEDQKVSYAVTVPTYRATKDITGAHDLVEEIARFIGYSTIIPQLPTRVMAPFDIHAIKRLRALKQQLAFGIGMNEVQTYAFYDEEFLKIINYNPDDALRIANPLSEHWQRLVTSLVPNLLKCVVNNSAKHETLQFFECNRIWFLDRLPVEAKECSGVFYQQKKAVDFYTCKNYVNSLFGLFNINITWVKAQTNIEPWYNIHETADLLYNNKIVGRAGKIDPLFMRAIGQGDIFIFELNAEFLLNVQVPEITYKPLAKYPQVEQDISMLVALTITAAQLKDLILHADPRIIEVNLIDFFERPEWVDQKSVTIRYIISDEQKTLTKEEIDMIGQKVAKSVKNIGAAIR